MRDPGAAAAAVRKQLKSGEVTCRLCGRPLADPTSIRAGYGPTCARHRSAERARKRDRRRERRR
ncbi:DUF6011 domain-containing protein [Streptomyces sp. NPDC048603]|uniref:DUF6011 domain-containing protein n=1 Tax=Streptomyces sp. NPDC048603 TaxID=3365577 RepID=UPI003721B214